MDYSTNLTQKEAASSVVILPISIGSMEVGNLLIDLGATVCLIPLSVVKKMGDLQIEPIVPTL